MPICRNCKQNIQVGAKQCGYCWTVDPILNYDYIDREISSNWGWAAFFGGILGIAFLFQGWDMGFIYLSVIALVLLVIALVYRSIENSKAKESIICSNCSHINDKTLSSCEECGKSLI